MGNLQGPPISHPQTSGFPKTNLCWGLAQAGKQKSACRRDWFNFGACAFREHLVES